MRAYELEAYCDATLVPALRENGGALEQHEKTSAALAAMRANFDQLRQDLGAETAACAQLASERNRLVAELRESERKRIALEQHVAEWTAKLEAASHDGGAECSYCHGVGACPRCWGRAAIERLTREDARLAVAGSDRG